MNGERITVQEVNEAGGDYETVPGQDVLPAAVACTLVDAQFVNEIAAGYGLGCSDAEVAVRPCSNQDQSALAASAATSSALNAVG